MYRGLRVSLVNALVGLSAVVFRMSGVDTVLVCERLLADGARRLPKPVRRRYSNEWLAEFDVCATAGPARALGWTYRVLLDIPTFAEELQGSAVFEVQDCCAEDMSLPGRTIVIAQDASIIGTLRCREVRVEGHFRGTIHAWRKVTLTSTARVEAAITTNNFQLSYGGVFNGRVQRVRTKRVKQLNFLAQARRTVKWLRTARVDRSATRRDFRHQ
jgi:hypothetical protein